MCIARAECVNFVESLNELIDYQPSGAQSKVHTNALEPTRTLAVFGIERPTPTLSSSLMPSIVVKIVEALHSNWEELGLTSSEPIASTKLVEELPPVHLLLTFKEARGLLHY